MSEPLSPLPFVDPCALIHSPWQNHLSRDGIYRNVTDNALSFNRIEFIDATLLSKWGLTLEDINAMGPVHYDAVFDQAGNLSDAKKDERESLKFPFVYYTQWRCFSEAGTIGRSYIANDGVQKLEHIRAFQLAAWGLTLEDINAIGTASLGEVYIQAQELSDAKKAFIKETNTQMDAALASAASYTPVLLDITSNPIGTYWHLTDPGWSVSLIPAATPDAAPSCTHEWKEYIGLTNRFDYCTKCDEKKK